MWEPRGEKARWGAGGRLEEPGVELVEGEGRCRGVEKFIELIYYSSARLDWLNARVRGAKEVKLRDVSSLSL